MTKFYFIRHGQTEWNKQGRMLGHSDIPLNETGVDQASKVVEKLAGLAITKIVSSPLLRTLQTAAIISEGCNYPIWVDSGLKERSFGSFEGLVTAEQKVKYGLKPEESITCILPKDAEQWPQTVERSATVILKWLEKHPEETFLFVSHAAFLGLFMNI